MLLLKEIFSSLEKVSGIPLDTHAGLAVQALIGFQELLHMHGMRRRGFHF